MFKLQTEVSQSNARLGLIPLYEFNPLTSINIECYANLHSSFAYTPYDASLS